MKPAKSVEETPPRLGRGLAALLGGAETLSTATRARGQQKVPIEFLRPNPRNPRQNFGDGSLDELAASIKEKASSNPFSRGPLREAPAVMRSSQGSGAGGRRNARGSMRCRSSASRPTTARR